MAEAPAGNDSNSRGAGGRGFGAGSRPSQGERSDRSTVSSIVGSGERGFGGKPRRAGGRPPKGEKDSKETEVWIPTTKLGRLVKSGRINALETIYNFSLPIKEYQIIDKFLPSAPTGVLVDEVLKIMPVQKQTPSGQRTRFKAFVVVGDRKGHVGLGVKCSKEVATAIRGGIIAAKLSIIPVRLGYWGNKIGAPHTVPTKVTGKCGSVRVRLVPAPRGTGRVAAGTPHKLLEFAGVDDVFTKCQGHTKTLGNFAIATFNAIQKTYEYQTPDLWKETSYSQDPYHLFSRDLEDLAVEGKKEEAKRAGRLQEDRDNERREGGGNRREGGRGFGGDRDFRQQREGFGGDRGFGGGERRPRYGDRDGQQGSNQGGEGQQNQGGEGSQQGGEAGAQQGGERGFGRQNREGGDRREGGGFGERRGYGDRGNREGGGGYRGNRDGGDSGSQGGYRGNRDGGERREGGYRGNRDGGDSGSQGGGYRGNRDGGERREGGGYRGNRDGGDNRREGGFRRREQGEGSDAGSSQGQGSQQQSGGDNQQSS